jgi:DNA-directed RNA polymerase specialized sigma24 family protein
MISNYYKARRYAWWLVGTESLDLIHDSYLTWYKKCQKNLFEEHERTVIAVVKLEWRQRLRDKLRMVNGKLVPKTVSTPDDWEPVGNSQQHSIDFETLVSVLPYKNTTLMLSQGYLQSEIAEMTGVSANRIHQHVNKLRECLR